MNTGDSAKEETGIIGEPKLTDIALNAVSTSRGVAPGLPPGFMLIADPTLYIEMGKVSHLGDKQGLV